MRILFIAPRIPHPIRGRRAYDLVRWLATRHELDLLTFSGIERMPPAAALAHIAPCFGQIETVPLHRVSGALHALAGLAGHSPARVNFFASRRMQAAVNRHRADGFAGYDVVYVKRVQMAQFFPPPAPANAVLDLTDCLTLYHQTMRGVSGNPARQLLNWEEWLRMRGYEGRLGERFARILVCTERDRRALLEAGCRAEVEVIPNGVDTEYFHPQPVSPEPKSLVFVGHLGGAHNREAAELLLREIFPRVRSSCSEARLTIVGAGTPRAWLRNPPPGVRFTGHVPDIRPFLAGAAVVVAPVPGGAGMKNKVLEPMAMRRPVVALAETCAGIHAVAGQHLRVAADAPDFADAVIELLAQPEAAEAMAMRARAWVDHHLGPAATLRAMEQYCRRLPRARTAAAVHAG